jgi:hypothetical protein
VSIIGDNMDHVARALEYQKAFIYDIFAQVPSTTGKNVGRSTKLVKIGAVAANSSIEAVEMVNNPFGAKDSLVAYLTRTLQA